MRFEKINLEILGYGFVLSRMFVYPTELVSGNYQSETNLARVKNMIKRQQYNLGIIRRQLRVFK